MKKGKAEVREKVTSLLKAAAACAATDPAKARQFVHKARRAAMRVRMRLPVAQKRRFCRECETFWLFGTNARVRYRDGIKVIYCLQCKHFTRIPYQKRSP